MKQEAFVDSRAEMEQILREEEMGHLGLSADGQPYVVPLNYAYLDGRIVFHCALAGQKLDAIRQNPRVCFTVSRQLGRVSDHAEGDPCHVDSSSVVCYGRARLVEDLEERGAVLNAFNRRFRPNAPDLPLQRVERCMAVEIAVARMTGRQETARACTFWRFEF